MYSKMNTDNVSNKCWVLVVLNFVVKSNLVIVILSLWVLVDSRFRLYYKKKTQSRFDRFVFFRHEHVVKSEITVIPR